MGSKTGDKEKKTQNKNWPKKTCLENKADIVNDKVWAECR